jgi:predicted porin
MNKKVMALAVAGVLAAPAAFAQSSNVQLYGRANVGLDYWKATGATDNNSDLKGRVRVFDNSSRVGVRGTEDLGNGLKAIFQIETGVNMDSGSVYGQNGATNASAGTWGSRPSFVGIDSNFGRLTFGRQDVYWGNSEFMQIGANIANTDLPFLTGGLGRVGVGVSRQSNVVQYNSPTFAGMTLQLSYSPDTNAAGNVGPLPTCTGSNGFGNSECVGGGQKANAQLWAARLYGRWGPFGGQIDYAQKTAASDVGSLVDATGNSIGKPKNQGFKVDIGWAYMPGAMLSAQYQKAWNKNVIGGFSTATGIATGVANFANPGDDVNADSWALHWEHTFGNIQPWAEIGWVTKAHGCSLTVATGPTAGANGCDDTDTFAWNVGARYLLSKRTWLYVQYSDTSNSKNNTVDNTGGAITSANPLPRGADPKIAAFGIFHQF